MNTETIWFETADADFEMDDPPVFLAGIKPDLQKAHLYYDLDYDYETGRWLPRPKVIGVKVEYAAQQTFVFFEHLPPEIQHELEQAALDHIEDGA